MKLPLQFLILLLLSPPVLYAQQAPKASFYTPQTSVCDTPNVVYFINQSSGNPTSWRWYFPGAVPDTSTSINPTVTYTQLGYHSVKLVVRNNFGSDSLTQSNYIFVDSIPHIKLIGSDTICYGSRTTLEAIGGSIYHWNIGATTSAIHLTGIISFTYTVQVSDGICFKDTSISLYVDSMRQITFRGDTSLCLGDSTTIYASPESSSYHYLWSTGSTENNIKVSGKKTGSYTYYLSVRHDSCSEDSLPVTINVYNCTGIENYHNASGSIVIYPNPNNGVFQLKTTNYKLGNNTTVEIYNMLGEKVYSNRYQPIADDYELSLSSQPNGVYLYRVIDQTGSLIGIGKFFIQK